MSAICRYWQRCIKYQNYTIRNYFGVDEEFCVEKKTEAVKLPILTRVVKTLWHLFASIEV